MTHGYPPIDSSHSPGLRKAITRLKIASEEQIERALETHKDRKLISALAKSAALNEKEIINLLAKDLQILRLDLTSSKVFDDVRKSALWSKMDSQLLLSHRCVPLKQITGETLLVLADPLDMETISRLEFSLGCRVNVAIDSEQNLLSTIDRLAGYGAAEHMETDTANNQSENTDVDLLSGSLLHGEGELEGSSAAPVITFVNQILSDAYDGHASDIHFEPAPNQLDIRYRIDGVMAHQVSVPKRLQPYIITRVKILSGMDITEKRRPQDGRFRIRSKDGVSVDVRTSTVPTAHGEKIVLRMLGTGVSELSLDNLAMPADVLQKLRQELQARDRIILVVGPTGSGKTTTLYSAINELCGGDNNIITIEDPIEIRLEGISQIQVDQKVGMTFATGLRSVLRQDPDIILVGEIRDLETAEISMQASQTGHLVLSTLHTNSAPATIVRLLDLGLAPFVIASSIGAIVAQRLVRKLCPHCSVEDPDPAHQEMLRSHGFTQGKALVGRGCESCESSGFRGRVGVYSLLVINPEIRDLIRDRASESLIQSCGEKEGFRDLSTSGLEAVMRGLTTIDEVQRVIGHAPQRQERASINNSEARAITAAVQERESLPIPVQIPKLQQLQQAEKVSIEALAVAYKTGAIAGNSVETPRILFVDDDEGIRAVISRILRKAEFEVCEAANGYEALDKLSSFNPHLILSDVIMPGMDGREFVQELRKDGIVKVPVMMLTGSDDEENEISLLELGANDFISKSSSPTLLITRIKRLLARA